MHFMAKEYNRSVPLEYWCVSFEDLKEIYDLFKTRISNGYQKLEVTFSSGDKISEVEIKPLFGEIVKKEKEKDSVKTLFFFFLSQNGENSQTLSFNATVQPPYTYHSSLNVSAKDSNGEFKDWVHGVLSDFDIKKKKFELEDKNRETFKKCFTSTSNHGYISFDFNGKEKEKITNGDKIDKHNPNLITINIDGDHNFSNNKIKNTLNFTQNTENWYQTWWGQLIILIGGGLILAVIVYVLDLNK